MARAVSKFIPLRCRTPYSILEGALKVDDLVKRLKEWRIPAVGMTDTNNVCGALEFSEKMCSAGIQPIMGCTLSLDVDPDGDAFNPNQQRSSRGTIIVLAINEQGYENLMKLSSAATLEIESHELPHIKLDHLRKFNQGLIVLSGGGDGVLNRLICDGQIEKASETIGRLSEWFKGNFYIELQRHGLAHEIEAEPHLIDLAYALDLPLVATNEPYFLDKDMHKAHDALLAISEGSYILEPDRRKVSVESHLKSPEHMVALFKDIPEAIENTHVIAKKCAFRSPMRKPILPSFGDGNKSEDEIMAQQARDGLEMRLKQVEPAVSREDYFKRLDFELGVIKEMGFPGYFLIVSDFIKWAKEQGIPVGPGRGSGAGSVVAWALTITDLDPLRYGLLFERFLNPERVSMPDFDIDFCQERRSEVIRYVQEKYGEDQVAHIITFGTLQARAVVRDVGRVLQMPLGQVDRLAKLVPSNPANPVTLAEAIKLEPALQTARDEEAAVAELLSIALQLEGLYRNASTHAAGVVIGDRPLSELVALYLDPRSNIPATQFTMKWVEKAGLVKFDFLGLKTLTVIDRALKYLKKRDVIVDMDAIPIDDELSYKGLAAGLSQGVFQLESSGMRDTLRKMAPDSIEELTALISLYRPGPMKNIDSYINRKFGTETIEYPHPSIAHILKETYGIIIYQEQVMQIAQVLSGYSLGDADILRRAMGKKDKAEMLRQKTIFIEGAKKNDVDEKLSSDIFELVNEFAGYGFNKSHAAAYAMISYRTAYLKANYPVEFIAASMSLEIANVDKLALFHKEAGRMGLDVVLPSVNETYADFEVKDGKILYALGAVKNVGLEAMRHVVEVREKDGPFTDLFDFARRVDARIVNKRAYENLSRAGAFECLETNRARSFGASSTLQAIGTRASQERNSAQVSLFGEETSAMAEPDLPEVPPWELVEKLDEELRAVGFYISGHPLERQLESLKGRKIIMVEDISQESARRGNIIRVAGVLQRRQERISGRTGKRFAYLNLSDPTDEYEVFLGEDLLGVHRERLVAGALLELQVKLDLREGEVRMTCNGIRDLMADDMANSKGDRSGRQSEVPTKPSFGGINVYVKNQDALEALKRCIAGLEASAVNAPPTGNAVQRGQMNIVVPLDNAREVLVALKGEMSLDERVQSALKAVQGVERINPF